MSQGYLTQEQIGDLDQPMARVLVAELAARALGVEPSSERSPFSDVDNGYLTALYELGNHYGKRGGWGDRLFAGSAITRRRSA